MKVQPSIGPKAGFTLVESMLTLAIMSVGLLALAGLQITALRGNDLSRRMTTAVSIAEQRLEQLKNTPYTNIQAEAASESPHRICILPDKSPSPMARCRIPRVSACS